MLRRRGRAAHTRYEGKDMHSASPPHMSRLTVASHTSPRAIASGSLRSARQEALGPRLRFQGPRRPPPAHRRS
jgi:hypothetical protein